MKFGTIYAQSRDRGKMFLTISIRKENQMFGLPLTTCFWLFGYTGLALIGTLIYALSGNYEGKSTEEKYHLDDWYNTF